VRDEDRAAGSGARRHLTLSLARREVVGEGYHVLELDAPLGLDARAGQFAMIRGAEWGDAPLLPRPMSLLTAGARPSILIKVVGEGTRRLARAEPGERFDLLAPLGRAWSPPRARRAVLVAGGVGLAPLLFFAREIAADPSLPRPLALYGGRTARDLPLADELAAVTELRVATEDGSRGTKGRVTTLLDAALADADGIELYTCGPDAMMAAVAELAERAGAPCEASLETPMACGYGVCLGCPVALREGGYLYACVEGPCVDARAIAWRKEPRS
jgi:dihydroorotate dehydrogenase electron transfer subunit